MYIYIYYIINIYRFEFIAIFNLTSLLLKSLRAVHIYVIEQKTMTVVESPVRDQDTLFVDGIKYFLLLFLYIFSVCTVT